MSDVAVRDAALEFFYSGFYRALRRYRRAAVTGWAIVAAGFVGILLGWDFAKPPGLYQLGLCLGAIAAGLVLIQGNIEALSSYVRIPLSCAPRRRGGGSLAGGSGRTPGSYEGCR